MAEKTGLAQLEKKGFRGDQVPDLNGGRWWKLPSCKELCGTEERGHLGRLWLYMKSGLDPCRNGCQMQDSEYFNLNNKRFFNYSKEHMNNLNFLSFHLSSWNSVSMLSNLNFANQYFYFLFSLICLQWRETSRQVARSKQTMSLNMVILETRTWEDS